ncbi:cGMP phosphodiesterase type I [Dictyostelium purpureum]|uniref:Phosphodiesterase n=1 Tax=Dictyostelium purpureum TaxID=5786 RepID=F0ZLZ6_DICPU|nr:cGMP phosphodiesterase type I [Dictyostelium purpureum]EGC35025.1 cGMP phosphodiesterase type I [Dictyostelium purpureum]|eukprot:XP_003288453.1 cGMP phosphodiesterase type I [Dictyostelium purpureum]
MELIRSCFEGVIRYSNNFRSTTDQTSPSQQSTSSKYNETITADGSSNQDSATTTTTTINIKNNDNANINHNVHSLNSNNSSISNEKNGNSSVNDKDYSENSRSINDSNNGNSNSENHSDNNSNNEDNDSNGDNSNNQQDEDDENNINKNNINGATEENDIFSINFSSWSKNKQLLIENGKAIFEASGLVKDLNLTDVTEFLEIVSCSYRENPFHSFNHAIAVTQTVFLIFIKANLLNILTPIEKLSIIIASICHDLDHPALSNKFQINIKSPIAVLYDNKSVLENHHLSICLKILSSDVGSKLMETLSEEEKEIFLNKVKILILATDMENHFSYKSQFDEAILNFNWENTEHRDLLLIMLLKSADISNELRSFDISNKWANALMQEFFNQSDLEKLNNIPVTPFMEREKVVLHLTQVSFIEKFLLPSYQSLQVLLPSLEDFVTRIKENKETWSNTGN